MGRRYYYSLVRCVPNPRTGEFVNVAAIAGSEESGEWSVRQLQNESRARRLCAAEDLAAVHQLLAWAWEQIDLRDDSGASPMEALSLDWLRNLHHDHRNVVQFSEPRPIIGDAVEQVLDMVFERLLIDPVRASRDFLTKHTVMAALRDAFVLAEVPKPLWRPRPEMYVGDRVHTTLDFAIANGQAIQLSQAWSFQRGSIQDLSTEVKAWGYALGRLRDGDDSRIVAATDNSVSIVPSDVDIQVLVAPPRTTTQLDAFEEARQVFASVDARVNVFGAERAIADRAIELLAGKNRAGSPPG